MQILVPQRRDETVLRRVAVFVVERIEHAHPFDDAADRDKALRVELGIVLQIEEELMRARVRRFRSERQGAARIALRL